MVAFRSLVIAAAVLAATATHVVVPANAQTLPATSQTQPVLPVQARSFLGGDDGGVELSLPGGTVTLDVKAGLTFVQPTTVQLAAVDPSSVPPVPGVAQDGLIVRVSADDAYTGADLAQLPVPMTLGIFHADAVSEPGLVLARLDSDGWTPLPTTVDPGSVGRQVSATIQSPGTYTVYEP